MVEKRELSDKQQKFLDALFEEANGNFRAAMNVAGYSKGTKPMLVVSSLREEIIELTQTYLAANGPLAAVAMTGVITDPTALGNRDRLSAAREILDRTGIVKTERVSVQTDSGGLFIMPPKKPDNNSHDDG
tara:strand:+ start:283 stop:675 length:393 start_codon:yes stop_codon:yes gene_type:complete